MLLSDYLAALKRGWITILVALVLALAAGTAYVLTRSQAPVYTSSVRLYVETVADDADDPGISGPTVDLTMNRTASYAAMLGGNVVADQVSEALGGRGDESVVVTAPVGTVIIDITVTSGDAERASEVAQEYVDIAPSVIEELDQGPDDRPRVEVSTVDAPAQAVAAARPSPIPILAAAGVLGLGLGVSIALVREMLRRERAGVRAPTASEPV